MTWTTLPGGVTVNRRRYTDGPNDRYGKPTKVPTVTALPQVAAFDPGGTTEPVERGRTSVVTEPTLYFIEAVDLTSKDEVQVSGEWFLIDGSPRPWGDPFGSNIGGVEMTLKRVAG